MCTGLHGECCAPVATCAAAKTVAGAAAAAAAAAEAGTSASIAGTGGDDEIDLNTTSSSPVRQFALNMAPIAVVIMTGSGQSSI